MKALLIGGTGVISTAISALLVREGWELTLLNRGTRAHSIEGAAEIHCDVNDEKAAAAALAGKDFDVVADFTIFTRGQAERDYRLFRGRTRQFIFISSASVYQKPPQSYLVNEGTPHVNPYWEYSQNKIACEDFFTEKYREEGFPLTIVLPSHTYDETKIPVGLHGDKGSWQVARRLLDGKPVIVHGDGSSLWTLTHSRDFARAFVGLMGNGRALGQNVQITSDESLTWNQIYTYLANALGVPFRAVHISSDFLTEAGKCAGYNDIEGNLTGDKANALVFDNSKLKRLVPGFTARTPFEQGDRECVAWALAHKEAQVEDPDFDRWCDRVISARQAALDSLRG
jgi:nucleoside-diphosphate-sugar epimerase